MRRAREGDLARILEIERASFGNDAYDRNLFAEYSRKCGDLFLVSVHGTSVCGYLIGCLGGNGRDAELVSVAVDPPVRQEGAASALLDSLIRRLKRRGAGRLSLTVNVTNARAIALYRKYGFRRIRLVRKYYADGADGIRMRREL